MGSKVDGFVSVATRANTKEPVWKTALALAKLLGVGDSADRLGEAADAVQDMRELKSMLLAASEAVNERLEERKMDLHQLMIEEDMPSFSRKGQSFYMTTQRFVQADKQQGGTKNPALIEWLENNDLADLAAKTVNANSLRSAVNEWLDKHPVDAEDGDLDVDGEELAARIEAREQLLSLVILTERPTVGVQKASR